MIEIKDKTSCVGCGACAAVCPVHAIAMVEDDEGFAYPQVDHAVCINCGKCEKACCMLAGLAVTQQPHSFHAACLRDAAMLNEVSSGGAFWALALCVLERGGVVYGAAREGAGEVAHVRAASIDELAPLRRSKYLQSSLLGIYDQLQKDVRSGALVLFTGTPCQVAAVRTICGAHRENLVTCEVVCHGVPSAKAYRAYRAEMEASAGAAMVGVNCRDKSLGWKTNQYAEQYANGVVCTAPSVSHPFHSAYLKGLLSRPSCPSCRFAHIPRVADITLADFWGYQGELERSSEGMGISLVVCNTQKGTLLLKGADTLLHVEASTKEAALSSCRHLGKAPKGNAYRDVFLQDVSARGYHAALKRFESKDKRRRLLARIKRAGAGVLGRRNH